MGVEFIHAALDYGWFGLFQFLNPWTRDAQVKWFLDEYTRVCIQHGDERPSVVAHSLGTYIVAAAMDKYELRFDRIIFSGSIVYRDFPWSNFTQQFGSVLNDYGRRDFWAWVARCFVRDSGPSGVKGFADNANGFVIQREHPEFRHSDYHFRRNYRKVWIPFLRGEIPPDVTSADRRPINWSFVMTMLGMFLFTSVVLYFALPRFGFSIPAIRTWVWGPPVSKIGMVKFFDDRQQAFRSTGSPGIAEFKELYESDPQPQVEWEGTVGESKPVQGIRAVEIVPGLSEDERLRFGVEDCARCTFKEEHQKRAANLRKGDPVRIRGQIDGPVHRAVMLKNCEFVD